jgi:uncharacterized protein with von Willebrand factor type A (vWA) domain
MAKKKSLNDMKDQLQRIRMMAGTDRKGHNRINRAVDAYYRYRDNIQASRKYDNDLRREAQGKLAFMGAESEKHSQRTYMGMSNG